MLLFNDVIVQSLVSGKFEFIKPMCDSGTRTVRLYCYSLKMYKFYSHFINRWVVVLAEEKNSRIKYRTSTSSISSNVLEARYRRYPTGHVDFIHRGKLYRIDMETMTQQKMSSGKQRAVLRVNWFTDEYTPSSTVVRRWQESDGTWIDYDISDEIKTAYADVPDAEVSFSVDGNDYVIRFQDMEQENVETNEVRGVRCVLRAVEGASIYPDTWQWDEGEEKEDG